MPYGNNDGGSGEFTGAPSNILVVNDNVLQTTVTGSPTTFVQAVTTALLPPVTGYDTKFQHVGNNVLEIEFTGDTGEDYRIDFSGTVSSDNPSLDTYLVLKVDTDLQSEFTGGEKAYPLGLVFGAGSSPAVGFGITVYGKFTQGEKVRLHLASSDAGKLTLSDCIMFAVQIRSG